MNGTLETDTLSISLPRAELTPTQRQQMYHLLSAYFEGLTQAQFESDLEEKNRVILLTRGPRLVGFSTLLAYETSFDHAPVSVVYSGDTIVSQEAWGSPALPRAWIATVNELRGAFPRGRYYWLLLTSGFRTYRFLPVFWREFYPRFDRQTPAQHQRLLDQLARQRFGDRYDQLTGIVRFTQPQRLRAGLSSIPETRGSDPHVAFFAARNSGHARGDELACLTELGPENLTAAGRRMAAPTLFESHPHHR